MWPFAPPLPKRLTHPSNDDDLLWIIWLRDKTSANATWDRQWARWHRQWATAYVGTWAAWLVFMLWPSSEVLDPSSVRLWLLVVGTACGSAMWTHFTREALARGREYDAKSAAAEEFVQTLNATIHAALPTAASACGTGPRTCTGAPQTQQGEHIP